MCGVEGAFIKPTFQDINQLHLSLTHFGGIEVGEYEIAVSSAFNMRDEEVSIIPTADLACLVRNSTGAVGFVETETKAPFVETPFVETETKAVVRDLVGMLNGCGDFIASDSINDAVARSDDSLIGLTIGAWFYPIDANHCEMQPVICLTGPC
jgi:hypothetical protein